MQEVIALRRKAEKALELPVTLFAMTEMPPIA